MLYGAHTGVSSIALIVAAVFWTWLWGPLGLVLATPLTVCLVVMGRHVPRLSFLSVVLSDEDALTPAEDCYHRLLTPGERDEMELVDDYLKANSLAALYDSVFIPVLTAAETDARDWRLDQEQLIDVAKACATSSKTSARARRRPTSSRKSRSKPRTARTPRPRSTAAFFACPPARIATNSPAPCSSNCARAKFRRAKCLRQTCRRGVARPVEADRGRHLHLGRGAFHRHPRALSLPEIARAFPDVKIVIGLWGATEE